MIETEDDQELLELQELTEQELQAIATPASRQDMLEMFGDYLQQADTAKTPAAAHGAILQVLHAVHYLLMEYEPLIQAVEAAVRAESEAGQ